MNKAFLSAIIVLLASAANAQERDPFQPATWTSNRSSSAQTVPAEGATGNPLRPLEGAPLNAYVLEGVVVSSDKAFAVIRAQDRKEYFLKVKDALGKEGGHIETIQSEGITVNTGASLITIPVSNKIEVKPDDKDK